MRSLTLIILLAASGATQAGSHGAQRPNFDALDSDGDGSLSAEEFSQLPARGGRDPADIFARLDSDGSGDLSQDELAEARSQRQKDGGGQGPGARFEELDTDGDDRLSAEELSALPTRGTVTEEQRLQHLDSNSDGYVTRDELHDGAQQRQRANQ